MRLRRIVVAALTGLLAVAPAAALAADQGPGYLTSSPANGEKRAEAPAEVWIAFDMPLDPSSDLRVFDECKRRIDDKNVEVLGNRISVGIDKTPNGHYEAHWKVKAPGGALGEEVGNLHFEVTSGTPCGVGGHQHHGGGSGKGNGGGGHGGGDGNHGGGGGGDHDGGSGGHSGTSSSSTGHTSGSTHVMADGSRMADHEMDDRKGHGKGKGKKRSEKQEPPAVSSREIAAPGVPGAPPAEGQAVLIALLMCMTLGVAGGYVVRVSGRF